MSDDARLLYDIYIDYDHTDSDLVVSDWQLSSFELRKALDSGKRLLGQSLYFYHWEGVVSRSQHVFHASSEFLGPGDQEV